MGAYMREFEVNSLDELLQVVKELTEEYGSRIWYRGQADRSWELVPSIQRGLYSKTENYITNDFYIRAKQVMNDPPAKENYAAWMSVMQHYGMPTRLLDWSMSPLISAFFATEKYKEHENTDACIWVLFPRMLNELQGFGSFVMPNDAYSVQQMLIRAFKDHANIDAKFEDKIIACCSTEKDLRMYSQQAAFTVHNTEKRLLEVCNDKMLFKLIIPSERRAYFLSSLDYFGINQMFIYPDVEHIANEIKGKCLK